MKEYDIKIYAKLMAEGFLDDPGIQQQLRGIADDLEFLTMQCRCQIAAFEKLGGMTTYGDGKGLVMGYFSGDEERLMQQLQEESSYLVEHASAQDLNKLQQNVREVAKIVQPDWYRKYVGDREVYILQAIVVHPALRGTGAFRTLLSPVLQETEKRGTPVALQTHVRAYVVMYEHFGFRLMETDQSDSRDLVCYNLLKNNSSNSSSRDKTSI